MQFERSEQGAYVSTLDDNSKLTIIQADHNDEHGMFDRFLHSQVASSGVLVVFALLSP